ncbi:MAG TPA: nucleotidyltransferase family protein [Micromonosporaceae bacterium]|nr:nucleotidyltransferase family protein [Micromonosporaceae bacterium]
MAQTGASVDYGEQALGTVAGLVLAAGAGQRLGSPKALLRLADEPLVDRAVRVAVQAGCAPLVVVLGCAAEQVRKAARLEGAVVVVNEAWTTGMGSSLRAGLEALASSSPDVDAAAILLVDTPGVTPAAVGRVAALSAPQALAVATYDGRRGHPVLLGRGHWSGVCALARGDEGARTYLAAHAGHVREVACDDVADGSDMDTPADAQRWGIQMPAKVADPPSGPP